MADDDWIGTGDDQFVSTTDDTWSGVTSKTLVSIAVTPAGTTLYAGSTRQYTATGTYDDASTADITSSVTWASSQTGYATIAAGGLATGVAAGATTISAALAGITGNTGLTVLAVTLTSIAVTPAGTSAYVGGTQQYVATGTYNNGSTQVITSSVAWTSSNTGRATITSPGGLASALSAGVVTITATLGGVSGNTSLTVLAVTLTSIVVTPSSAIMTIGSTQQFTATGYYNNGSSANVTASCTWFSSDTYYVTITSPAGLATGVRAGSTSITASLSGFSDSSPITVQVVITLTSITVTPSNQSILAGHTQQYAATGNYSNGTTADLTSSVTWSSSIAGYATISAGGLATGVGTGLTVISAAYTGVTGTTNLNVLTGLMSIVVTPANETIASGASQQYIATGHYSDSSTQVLTSVVEWSASVSNHAVITKGGLAIGIGHETGTAQIRATYQGVSGVTNLTVTVTPTTLGRLLYNNYITNETMLTASSLRTGTTTTTTKIGIGSASLTPSGAYTGAVDIEYMIRIDHVNTGEVGSSTFQWSTDGGTTWTASDVVTDDEAISLSNGISIAFASGIGADFALNDTWYFKAVNSFSPGQMLDMERDHRHRSAALSSPNTYTIDLGSARGIQAIIIGDHNLTSNATITLHGNASNSWESPTFSVTVTWASLSILQYLASTQTFRYWQLRITDTGNPSGYIEISSLYLGTYLQLSKNYMNGFSKGYGLLMNSNTTSYGVKRSRYYNTQIQFVFDFDMLPSADITSLTTLLSSIVSRVNGTIKPFWFNDDSGIPANTWMVNIEELPVKHIASSYYETSLKLTEVMRTV